MPEWHAESAEAAKDGASSDVAHMRWSTYPCHGGEDMNHIIRINYRTINHDMSARVLQTVHPNITRASKHDVGVMTNR